ncbi:MAG: hypothetical protein AAGE52_11975 [Myxococcota bacterium]
MRCALVLLLGVASSSAAQDARTEARAEFQEAQRLLGEGRLAAGRDRLLRSLELYPTAPAAFNLVLAYRGTGEARAGQALTARLLAGEFGELDDERRAQVEAVSAELASMLGRVTFLNETAADLTLSLDAEESLRLSLGGETTLELDVGAHLVSASAEGFLPLESIVRVGAGSEQRFGLQLEAVPVLTVSERKPLRIALIVLAGVALIATGVTLAVLLPGRTEDPTRDPVFPTARLP